MGRESFKASLGLYTDRKVACPRCSKGPRRGSGSGVQEFRVEGIVVGGLQSFIVNPNLQF